MKAARYVLLEPEAALKVFLKAVPEIELAASGAEQTRLGIGLFQVAMLNPAGRGHMIGFSDPATFTSMTGLVMKALAGPGDEMPAQVMTNDFIGTVSLTADERTRADAAAEEFRKLVS
jgi:hypothetical protein